MEECKFPILTTICMHGCVDRNLANCIIAILMADAKIRTRFSILRHIRLALYMSPVKVMWMQTEASSFPLLSLQTVFVM